ncbi:nSTAND1 domain-containing NTPase [Allocoleopsis franciscana]|uniref:WD40 repeat-containing protein n=1 Tax=Allocoleopsis franciscana PCC 7113 TaxID=1173027 RepID=K9WRT0_9CYAN|nr:caspase family protein [Allocoleopsis franciscana]AFZ22262.1 WD40 repeat-containing protein [Allocoleopsis franciscana PCC 7113]
MVLTNTLIKAQKVATFKRSLAIVIGINEYQNRIPKLKTARRDAEVLAEILEKEHQYDEVVLITDETEFKPTLQNLLILLEERLPKEIKPTKDDRLLFYFAGHGIARDSDKGPAGCLVPQDADVEKSENLLLMQKLHECLTALSCRHLLVILDCCFAGTFRWSSTRLATVIPRVVHKEHYDRFIKSPAWQAITSAAHNQEALDVLCDNRGGANHSPFAEGLFKALRGEGDVIPAGKKGQPPGDGVITAAELYLYLRDHVELSSQERQTPGLWTLSKHDRGEFIFLVPGADLKLKPAPKLNENNNPYRGLSAFEEEHSQFFFGRQELIEELYRRIAHVDENYSQLTVVLGTSGSGKSSLVKAGLIPCLRQKYSQEWCILKPMRPGESPFSALARTILPITSVPVINLLENLDFISEILQEKLKRLDQEIYDTFDGAEARTDKRIRLEQEENKFNQIADTWNSRTPDKRLLLVVEQFEELNNLCRTDDERERLKQAFLDCINPLSERLQTDSKQFIEIIAAWSQQHVGVRLLLMIDQFEELITLSRNTQEDKQNSKPNESQQFLKLLEETLAATLPQLCIIVTLRSDFEPRFLSSEALKSHWTQARFPVRAMRSDELRQAIERPATEMALYFEPSNLVDKLIDEVGQMPGALPLLSFTLSELYLKLAEKWRLQETSDRALILDADFDKEGGVAGSLTRRANQEYDGLPNDAHRATMQRVMLRMVTTEGGESARRRVPLSELVYADKQDPNKLDEEENQRVELVLERLNHARLIVSGQETGEPYVEPAHDFLVRSWDKLQKWQQEEQEDLPLQRRLTPAALEWKTKEQSSSLLGKTEPVLSLVDKKLDSVEDWLNHQSQKNAQEHRRERKGQFLWNGNPYLDVLKKRLKSYDYWFNQVETEFVQRSVWQRRRNTNLRWGIAIGVILLSSGLTIWALRELRNSLIGQISTARESSETRLRTNQLTLNALINSLQAGKSRKHWLLWGPLQPNKLLQNQVLETLQHAVYSVKERNYWQLPKGKVLDVFLGQDNQLFVAIKKGDETACVWDSETKTCSPLSGNLVEGAKFSPDGRMLSIFGKDRTVRLWNLESKQIVNELAQLEGSFKNISFSPDGKQLAIKAAKKEDGSDNISYLWDLEQNRVEPLPENNISISFNADGHLLMATLKQMNESQTHVELLNLSSGKVSYISPEFDQIDRIDFSLDGKQLIITGGHDAVSSEWWRWNLENNNWEKAIEDPYLNEADQSSFSSNGKLLITTGHVVRLYSSNPLSSSDLSVLGEFNLPQGAVENMIFSADGKHFVTQEDDGVVHLWDVEQLQPETEHQFSLVEIEKVKIESINFSPDGQQLVTGGKDGFVRFWDLNGNELNKFQAYPNNAVKIISWAQNGQKIATMSDQITEKSQADTVVKVWKLSGQQSDEFSIKLGNIIDSINDINFQKNGSFRIISSANEGRVVWLDSSGLATTLNTKRKETYNSKSINFNADGSLFATTSFHNGTVTLWDLQGRQLMKFQGYKGEIKNVGFSADGSKLAVVGEDGKVKLWQLGGLDELLQRGCERARDYLATLDEKNSDRHLCDNIPR